MNQVQVQSVDQDGVMFISWANPSAKNALTRAMYRQLTARLLEAQARDDIKVCVLLGGEGDFCSGNDLGEFLAAQQQGVEFFTPLLEFIHLLSRFNKPLLAGVQGWTIGIGASLLLHCDVVIANADVQIGFPFTKLGLCTECGASLLLPLRVGQGRAADWLLRAEPILAEEALSAGFVTQVQPDPRAAITAYAQMLVKRPLNSLMAHRRLLQAPWAEALKKAMADEETTFFQLLMSDDFRSIVAAMNAKWQKKPE